MGRFILQATANEFSFLSLWKVDQFLDQLVNYDKENIHENNLKAVQPYLADPEFEPDFIRSKSGAAAGICAWCINIIKFYHVFCDVEPKRQALAAANAELAAAEEKLAKIKSKIAELDENLAELTASFEKVIDFKVLNFKASFKYNIQFCNSV